jgi:hypothetical protein
VRAREGARGHLHVYYRLRASVTPRVTVGSRGPILTTVSTERGERWCIYDTSHTLLERVNTSIMGFRSVIILICIVALILSAILPTARTLPHYLR